MSVPTLTGLTSINAADSTTNWSGWGQNSTKWALESDIIKEGSGSQGLGVFQTGDGGWGYTSVGGIDLTANLLMVWVYTTPGFANTLANYGVYIRVCTSTTSWTTEYSDYRVGGSDVAWFGRGWHLVVLDINRTADRSAGTTTKTNINRIGVGFNATATASKSTIFCIDAMYYGTGLEVTGPSFTDGTNGIDINSGGTIDRNDGGSWITDGYAVGDYVKIDGSASNDGVYGPLTGVTASVLTIAGQTFTQETAHTTVKVFASVTLEDIYQKDGPTDDLWKGVVDKDPSGAYVINYPMTIGDVSGASDCFFLSRGEVIVLADQPLDGTLENYIITAEDTGETFVLFGDSTGTGDSRVGFAGSVIVGQGTVFDDGGSTSSSVKTPRGVDFDAEISGFELYGTSLLNADGGATFAATGTGHFITNVTFDSCGQVTLGAVQSRNLTFSGYSGAEGALKWSASQDLKNSRFLANSIAIEHETEGDFSYIGLTFAGNTTDVKNSNNATSVQSYANTNQDSEVNIGNGTLDGVAQSFAGAVGQLVRAQFYLRKVGSPTGNATVKLYAHSGTFGTSSVPTGATLVAATVLDVSTLTGSLADVDFFFEAAAFYDLIATNYCIAIEYTGGDGSNYVVVGYDGSAPTSAGNAATLASGGGWTAQSYDLIHAVWRDGEVQVNASSGANPTTKSRAGSPASAIAIINTVSLKVTVLDEAGSPVQTAQTGIYALETAGGVSKGDELISGSGGADTNASGVVENANFNYGGAVNVEVRSRKSSAADNPRYKHLKSPQVIGASGLNVTVTLLEDPQNN